MKLPDKCQTLDDIRVEIDRIDAQIIAAFGKRLDYVKAASAFKADEKSIPAPERVAAMLLARRTWALKAGLDPDFIEKIFRELIAWFINEQILYFRLKMRSRPGPSIDRAKLLQALDAGRDRAKSSQRKVLVSLTQRIERLDPIKMFDAARKCASQAFLWGQRNPEFAIVGVDSAQVLEGKGGERFVQVLAAWRALLGEALIDKPEQTPGVGPVLGGGFTFDPEQAKTPLWMDFPDASLVLPKLQLTNSADDSYLTLNVVVEANQDTTMEADRLDQLWQQVIGQYAAEAISAAESVTDRLHYLDVFPPAQWKHLVQDAVDMIRTGAIQKVVLAREVRLVGTRPFSIKQSLERLRDLYPHVYLFAIARGERCFFGATPEKLVRLNAQQVEVTALAGTCRRGRLDPEDQLLGEQLMASAKDRHEHALVVEMLHRTLKAYCKDFVIPLQPALLKLKNVQHLHTPIVAQLCTDTNLLELVAALHPTPAVGGLPSAAALAYLRAHEQLDRGWFAAPVGWIDAQGDGEFAVALRSALVAGNQASLFAGCGIVGDSEPESELAETVLKLRAMMFALGHDERQPR
jgi:isochorismate synthase/chorismate mutase-like protein